MNTALLFAAGRGERLRPITDSIPKPLCLVHQTPLIEYHIMHLAQAGFTRLIINHAHLGGLIRQQVGDGTRWGVEILYAPEPPGALETGGAIFNALPLLGCTPFVTVNADIFTDYNFSQLTRPLDKLGHLVLVNKPSFLAHGDFSLTKNNQVTNTPKHYTFSGIAVYHPALFINLKPGRYSITPILRELANQGCLSGEIYTGKWNDIGTAKRLYEANQLIGNP
ncbi:MAG: N-acetylmuramate alpha-1-phosphate uridylyltransferase MurU [Legionella sp.]